MEKREHMQQLQTPAHPPVQQPHTAPSPAVHKKPAPAKKHKIGLLDKIFLLILIASLVYILYLYFQKDIIRLLQMNPYVWAVFSHIAGEIASRTLLGLFYASFFGSLFFIFLPLEVLFLYYLSLGLSVPLVITLTLLGYLMGLCLDYLFGYVVGARLVKFILRGKFDKFHDMITRWGSVVVFFGNVIIFPIQPVSVVIGSAKYSFKKFFILSALGLFVKLFTLVIISMYVGEYITGLF
jgi:membrane protein DedA with SNARE-associated domain